MPSAKTAKKTLTLGDLGKKLSQIKLTQVLYILLLVAVFLIGYLLGRLQGIQAPTVAGTNNQQQAAAPAQPSVPDPKDVLSKLTDGHFPAKGNKNAKVTIVEFADFRCPFCERYFTDTESQIMKDYVDTGKVKYEFRNYQFLGDASVVAGNAAECANEQGKFWDYHEWLYKNQPDESDTSMYNTDGLAKGAEEIGLDVTKFRDCLDSKKYASNLDKDLNEGKSIGVTGTPTFYINGRQLVGAQPYLAFKTIIDEELKK
ncbi:MAG TPA: DsbA family protein [Patescibacteria group bacterium]|nr:DsbA family protein [Patescibacteria group bacterium]